MVQPGKHGGTAAKIEQFFQKHLNQPFTIKEIMSGCNLDPSNTGVSHKVTGMLKKGLLSKSADGYPTTYTAIPLHLINHQTKSNTKKKANGKAIDFKLKQQLTPEGFNNKAALFAATTSTPLDIPGMMQHIINVDEQNKVYRNALENIALILEQAGVIETTN